ncbi:MAG: hypothetical protein MZV70_70805 [Desulfobacterales bacterium]|nr:hypothetical protein [Desulfobacterales bacterium]
MVFGDDYRAAPRRMSIGRRGGEERLFLFLLGHLRLARLDLLPLAGLPDPAAAHLLPCARDPFPALLGLDPAALDPIVVDGLPLPIAGDPDVGGAGPEGRGLDPERGGPTRGCSAARPDTAIRQTAARTKRAVFLIASSTCLVGGGEGKFRARSRFGRPAHGYPAA